MAITTRAGKGAALTHTELDTNFTDLRDGLSLAVPKAPGYGLKVDSLGTPTFGWQDLLGTFVVPDLTAPNAPSYATFRGGIKQFQFALNDEASVLFHLPHDYVLGTDIHVHVHWSHGSSLVTGGTVTWGFELSYAKGHNQAAFAAPITIVEIQNASTTAFQHMICEAPASIAGGSANLLDTSLLEPDGILTGRLFLDSNDITVSAGGVPSPFAHTVDIHYQSSGVATKNRAPNFYG